MLCKELAEKYVTKLSAFSGIALTFLSKTIKEKVTLSECRTIFKLKQLTLYKMLKKHLYLHCLLPRREMILFFLIIQTNFMRNIQGKSKRY